MAKLVLLCFALVHLASADLIVKIQDGLVQGTSFSTPSGATYYAWRGIPYAKPPVGDLRFMPPVRPEKWTDVRNATTDGAACHYGGTASPVPPVFSEDCLFVNVYSPVNVSEEGHRINLPVILWIFGGGFTVGTGDFSYTDPSPFLAEDVVVVTFNHRLTALGFTSTGDEVISGNAGLKDQYRALIWTKENIAFFGGNAQNIVVMGESSGAGSVGYLLVAPMARNLFQGAIMQSGTTITNALQKNPKDNAYALAQKLDSTITDSNSTEEVKKVLQSANVEDILKYAKEIGVRFGAVIESKSNTAYLSDPLYESLESGEYSKVPIIIGHNSDETVAFYADQNAVQAAAENLDAHLEQLIPDIPLKDGANTSELAWEIKTHIVGENGSFSADPSAVLKWSNENLFLRASYKQALLESSSVPVYFYNFSFCGTPSKGHYSLPGAGKVGHTDEIPYLFNVSVRPLETDADFVTRKRIVRLWSNFAKFGDPTPIKDDLLQNIKWETVSSSRIPVLNIGDDLGLYDSDQFERNTFWDHVFETYSYRPYNTF